MKKIDMYELGEEVLIKVKVESILIDRDGEIKYQLQDEHGKIFDHMFNSKNMIPISKPDLDLNSMAEHITDLIIDDVSESQKIHLL